MKTKTILAALALTIAPSLALAMGCSGYNHTSQQAMSCADGTVWDATTQTCIISTTS